MPLPVALDVWLYGTLTARLTTDARRRLRWEWTDDAERRWGLGSRVVSNLLPIGDSPHPVRVEVFLDGYLPEGESRVHHAVEAGVEPDDTYGLVATYGRDLAGALILVPAGESPRPADARYEPIGLAEVSERLARASHHTGRLDARDSFSSLPGMVPKVLLHREGDQWFACRGGAPSTWIVKRSHDPDGPAADVIDTEVVALRCARRLGLGTVEAEVLQLDAMRAIAVSRYDRRRLTDGSIDRVHQEDLAQASGLNTSDPNRKFQRGPAAMPSYLDAAKVLTAAGTDTEALLSLMTFSYALGNTDMHAKNISFLHSPRARTILSPAYDISLHLHAAGHNGQVALQVNGKSSYDAITPADLVTEAERWGLPRPRATRVVGAVLRRLPAELEAERATGAHPGMSDRAWDFTLTRVTRLAATSP